MPAAGITAWGDAVRRPLTLVSFSILIPNVLASFFFFCARRLFHRGTRLRGIASDPFLPGGGITARGDVVRCPFMLVYFSILIPNTLSLFFSFCARRLFHRGASLGGIASDLSLDEVRRSTGVPAAVITAWGDAVDARSQPRVTRYVRRPFTLVSFLF